MCNEKVKSILSWKFCITLDTLTDPLCLDGSIVRLRDENMPRISGLRLARVQQSYNPYGYKVYAI